ncbi:cytochrome P450 [Streptomyces sp. NPDC001941]|uniref:cytochrome P450 n=1 Tax=Streptomyces sp. NPDC001941 TaxID=3154659 RepID=UPI003323074F
MVPGPRGLPLLGSLPDFGKDPLGFLTRLRDHGSLVTWRFGGKLCVFLSEPDCVGELLIGAEEHFDRAELGVAFRTLLGNGVVVAEGADWRRKRSLVQPSVRPKQVKAYASTMVAEAVRAADGWADGRSIELRREMSALTQRVAVRTIFGTGKDADVDAIGRAMSVAQQEIGAEMSGLGALLPSWMPTPGRARVRKAVAVIDREVARVVAEHRNEGSGRPDLLSRLLVAQDETGARLTDEEIRDETVTLYIGGHETTASALVWAWTLLSANPDVHASLTRELDRVLGDREPGFEDYEKLTYTQAVVKETLRLYPTIWVISGVAREGATVGGRRLPAGTRVWSSPWATHRDPRWFRDPEEFRPERWAPPEGTEAEEIPEYAWFPFGGGPRVCLGARFAMVEAVLVLAVLARRFRVDVHPSQLRPAPKLTLQPDREVWATVRGRKG